MNKNSSCNKCAKTCMKLPKLSKRNPGIRNKVIKKL